MRGHTLETIVAQAGGGVDIGGSCYFGGGGTNGVTCLLDQLVGAFGGPGLLGLLIGAVVFVGFWIASEGDLATPTVALILTGTVLVGMVPGQYQQLAISVVTIGLAAAIWAVVKKYVLSGAVR